MSFLMFVVERRESIELALYTKRPQDTTLKSLNWRIDVSVSTSSIMKSLVPVVIMQMELSDGRVVSFDVSLAQFHQFRFNVALVLKEMDEFLNKTTFKLTE